jgi:hypothetical protein
MGTLLLITRLRCRPVRPELAARPHWVGRLNAGLELGNCLARTLTLVSAWVTSQHRVDSWLSLSEGDNDSPRFLVYLLTALRNANAKIGHAGEARLVRPRYRSPETRLTVCLNGAATRLDRFLLVHRCASSAPPSHPSITRMGDDTHLPLL